MNNTGASPKFRNLCHKQKQSPKELKDKMRKNYKDKVHHCREMLIDRFRGKAVEQDLCNTLNEIYKSMFDFTGEIENDEIEELAELKNELIQEELEWLLREYEKSQLESFDWSTFEDKDSVICPVCQKSNLQLENNVASCPNCKSNIRTQYSLSEIKHSIDSCLNKHNSVCSHEPQFTVISEANDNHIYLICENCTDMTIVI